MGWEQLVIGLAWPVVGLVAVFLFRRSLAGLIGRINKAKTPIGDFEMAVNAIQQAATVVVQPAAVTVKSAPRAEDDGSTRLEDIAAIEAELNRVEKVVGAQRREEVEKLIRFAVEAGWALGTDGVGFPNVSLNWDENG